MGRWMTRPRRPYPARQSLGYLGRRWTGLGISFRISVLGGICAWGLIHLCGLLVIRKWGLVVFGAWRNKSCAWRCGVDSSAECGTNVVLFHFPSFCNPLPPPPLRAKPCQIRDWLFSCIAYRNLNMRRNGIPHLTVLLISAFFITWLLLPSSPSLPPTQRLQSPQWPVEGDSPMPLGGLSDELLHGEGIMPTLGNETLK